MHLVYFSQEAATPAQPTVEQVVSVIERMAPPDLAMSDDPTGFMCGSMAWPAGRILVALDAGPDSLDQAAEAGAGLLVSHHPLIYSPLSCLDVDTPLGGAISRAVARKVAVYSAHTNLDAAFPGINSDMADAAGLASPTPLQPAGEGLVKIVTFVPQEAADAVREALFGAGAGRIGGYSRCSFAVTGEGTFFGEEGSDPKVGQAGRHEQVKELRLEAVVGRARLSGVLAALRAAHPYEEPVVDAYPLLAVDRTRGLGLVGDLQRPRTLGSLAEELASVLKCRSPRVVGDRNISITRAAVCAGSGAVLARAARAALAQVLVTGDVKYHDARDALASGLAIIDLGHYAPERYGMEKFSHRLAAGLAAAGHHAEVLLAREEEPFAYITR